MDSFLEYMIKQKKTAKTILKSVGVMLAAFVVSLIITVIFFFIIPQLISVLPLTVAVIFYVAYRITVSFDVEFEYILTNGELDIDKITNKKRRKRLLTVHCKTFIAFGKTGSSEYINEENSTFARIIDTSANSDAYENYFAVFYINGQKVKLIFNPTQKMIDIFKIYAPRVVR